MSTPVVPETAGEVLLIDPALIDDDPDGRIGQFFPLKAEGLACRIDADGQLEPVLVTRAGNRAKLPWKLVAGRHRHAACLSLGRPIEARVVSGSKEKLRQLQASENLDRRRMTVLEEAMFVAAVADAAQARMMAKHGGVSAQQLGGIAKAARGKVAPSSSGAALDKSVHRSPRPDDQVRFLHPGSTSDEIAAADADAEAAMTNLVTAYGWRDEVRDALGLSQSHLTRALRIHRQLVVPYPDLMEALKEHPVADNGSALLKLAATGKAGREAELRALVAGEPAEEKAPPRKSEVLYNRALGALNKMEARDHDAMIEARIECLRIDSKRRILERLRTDLKAGDGDA